jgi:tetratricopeptide (TPR) repeat protein
MSLHSSAFRLMLLLVAATAAALALSLHSGATSVKVTTAANEAALAMVACAAEAPPAVPSDASECDEPIEYPHKCASQDDPLKTTDSPLTASVGWNVASATSAIGKFVAGQYCPALAVYDVCPTAYKAWVSEKAQSCAKDVIDHYREQVAQAPKAEAKPEVGASKEPDQRMTVREPLRTLPWYTLLYVWGTDESLQRIAAEEMCPPLRAARLVPVPTQLVCELARPYVDLTVDVATKAVTDSLVVKTDALPGDEAAEEPPAPPKEETETPGGSECAVPMVAGFGGTAAEKPKAAQSPILPYSSENCRCPVCPRCDEEETAPAPVVECIPDQPIEVEVIVVMPTEVVSDEEAAAKEPPIDLYPVNRPCPAAAYATEETQAPESTCPYLQKKKKEAEQSKHEEPSVEFPTAMENLERLIEANDLLTQCEQALEAKELEKARECCEKAQKLCPGSPLAHRAEDTMKFVMARFESESSEEAEQSVEMAKRLFHKADHYRLKGKFAQAEKYYRLVKEVCPESKLAHRASAELRLLALIKAEVEAAAEEAEPKKSTEEPGEIPLEPVIPEPISAVAEPTSVIHVDVELLLNDGKDLIYKEDLVADAVKAAKELLAKGQYEGADEAAHRALSIDCDCQEAQELVEQARKLLDEACDSGCHTDRGAADEPKDQTDASGLRHSLPKVDPKLIEAMEEAEEESEHRGVESGIIKTGIQIDPEQPDRPGSDR